MSKTLHRRTLLRGAGIALGLPLLEQMTPLTKGVTAAEGASAAAPVRMACVFFPNGVSVKDWRPEGSGDDWQLSSTLQPLDKMKSKIHVISGLAHDNGRVHKDGAGDHARCAATYLTAARPVKTSSNIQLGISVDQIAANQIGNQTMLPSIELGLTPSKNGGSCDSGYACAYSSNISWRSETQPMPKETTPRMAFERMFATGDSLAQKERFFYRKSILDVVSGDAKKLIRSANRTDRRKLDEYFSSLREIEQRIERTEKMDQASLPDLEVPYGRVEAFREHARLMYDVMAVGFQADSTRVASLMLDNAGGRRRYTDVGIKEAHHELSHHRNKESTIAKISQIDRYLVEQFAYFLERLDGIKEGEGTLLDNSMVLYGSGISDGNRHKHDNLPILVAGKGGGKINTGRHTVVEKELPLANLFMSMLDVMGTPVDSIGDSSGRLDGFVA